MEQFFRAVVITELIMLLIIIMVGLGFYLYDYYHPPLSAHDTLAGDALSRRTKLRIRLSASEILRRSVSSKTNMTAAGRALGQRMKS